MKSSPKDKDSERFDRRSSAPKATQSDIANAFGLLLPEKDIVSVEPLTGGFSNSNFLIKTQADQFVLRFHRMGKSEVDAEIRVLELCMRNNINVPKLFSYNLDFKLCPISVSEFVDGSMLSSLLQGSNFDSNTVFKNIGEELEKTHRIQFESSGLFGEGLEFSLKFENFSKSIFRHIESSLDEHAGLKLGQGRLKELRKCIDQNWYITENISPTARLVHSDFNPKNLLIENKSNKVFILDWEFAFSGSPVFDFGNLFRFAEDFPEHAEPLVVGSYKNAGGLLQDNWKSVAKLFDLINMCQFLNTTEDRPKTTKTAIDIVDRTLKFFA